MPPMRSDLPTPRHSDATQPQTALPVGNTNESPPPKPPEKRSPWRLVLMMLALFLVAVLAAGGGGYATGVGQREATRAAQIAASAEEQFQLGLVDLEAKRFEIARKRFEYIAELAPSYPQLAERLAEALLGLATPVSTPTPIASPTPNLAPVEEIFNQALAALTNEDWDSAIAGALALRAKDPAFKAVQSDGILYVALRNRGLERILAGDLEGGMYDLSLAERFAPIDFEADSWRLSADLYLIGNSYVGLNWSQAAYYFGEVCKAQIWDSCFQYGRAARLYGDQLVAAHDPCAAQEQYNQSLLSWPDGTLVPTATQAADLCLRATRPAPQATPTPTMEGTPAEPPLASETPTPEGSGSGG